MQNNETEAALPCCEAVSDKSMTRRSATRAACLSRHIVCIQSNYYKVIDKHNVAVCCLPCLCNAQRAEGQQRTVSTFLLPSIVFAMESTPYSMKVI